MIGPEISDDEPNPKPIVQEIYANWEAPAQTASGSFDFDYGIITNKVQLKTTEKVDGATIEIEPITQSGTIDGGTWNIFPQINRALPLLATPTMTIFKTMAVLHLQVGRCTTP